MDTAKLKTLIDSDPANAAKTDQQVLDWLKASVTVQNDVSWTDYMLWLSEVGGYKKLSDAQSDTNQTDAVRNAAGLAITVANAGQSLSLSRNDVRGALGPLVGPVFSTAERDSLLSISNEITARYLAEGFRPTDDPSWLYHIGVARNG